MKTTPSYQKQRQQNKLIDNIQHTTWPWATALMRDTAQRRNLVSMPSSPKGCPCLLTTWLKFGERCFSHAGPKAWNELPTELQDLTDHSVFSWRHFCLNTYSLHSNSLAAGHFGVSDEQIAFAFLTCEKEEKIYYRRSVAVQGVSWWSWARTQSDWVVHWSCHVGWWQWCWYSWRRQ